MMYCPGHGFTLPCPQCAENLNIAKRLNPAKERVYPALPDHPLRKYGFEWGVLEIEATYAYADPLLDEIDRLKALLIEAHTEIGNQVRNSSELRAIIENSELHLKNAQKDRDEARATIERQRELLNNCAWAMAAAHDAGLDGVRTDWTKMIDAITAMKAELEKK